VKLLASLFAAVLAMAAPAAGATAPTGPAPAAQATEAATSAQPAAEPTTADGALIDGRRRPGYQKTLPDRVEQDNPGAVNAPPPEAFYDKWDGEGSPSDLVVDTGVPDR
jgi:hypothetical protein